MKKIKHTSFRQPVLKPIVLGVMGALTSMTAYADIPSPFAIAPQHLSSNAKIQKVTVSTPNTTTHTQQQTVTNTTVQGYQGAKPNIMLLLDDSGSMVTPVSYRGPTRQQVLQNSLSKIVGTYQDTFNWGLTAFNSTRSQYNLPLGTNWQTVKQSVTTFPANGTTPTITSYIKAAEALNKGIEYRCQKSYLVLVSDGDSNMNQDQLIDDTGLTYALQYHYPQWLTINKSLNDSAFWKTIFTRSPSLQTYDKSSSKFRSMCNPLYLNYSNTRPPYKTAAQQYERNICNALPNQFAYYPYTGISDSGLYSASMISGSRLLNRLTSDLDFLDSSGAYYQYSAGNVPIFPQSHLARAGDMLGYLSTPLSETDLRTSADGQDKAGKSWDDKTFPNQNITTFTIGFGNGLSESGLALLQGGASTITNKDGKSDRAYYSAIDEAGLAAAFNAIIEQVKKENPPPTDSNPIDLPPVTNNSAPVSTPGTPGRQQVVSSETSYATSAPSTTGKSNSIPNMAASIYLPSGLKSSELRFYSLNDKAVAKTDEWRVADFSQRKALISTNNGTKWADNTSKLDNTFFGLSADGQGETDEWIKALLPWTTRQVAKNDDSTIQKLGYPTPYRIRPVPPTDSPRSTGADEYNMGDILDTPVLAIGDNGAAQGNRQEFLVTAANDGMVYLFQSNPDSNAKNPYALKLNYLPATMPRQTLTDTHATYYKDLAHESYAIDSSHPHLFMINGGMTLRTTSAKANNKHSFMVGTLGQGGRGMYALSIGGKTLDGGTPTGLHAPNTTWDTSVPLYETNPANNSADFEKLGYTVSYPQIGRIASKHNADGSLTNGLSSGIYYASFLSSGFAHPTDTQETALYIQDALALDVGGAPTDKAKSNQNAKGKLLAKMIVPNGVGGLASPTLLDVNRDGVYDFAFAGDYGGNMYRFDLRKVNLTTGEVANDAVKKIYSGIATQPITSAPAISIQNNGRDGRYVVSFGTGSDMYVSDFNSTTPQAIYGIYQRFNGTNLEPVDINDPSKAEGTNIPQAKDLLEQELKTTTETVGTQNVTVRQASHESIFNPTTPSQLSYQGWKVNLGMALGQQDGERVVVTPTSIFGTLIISTRIYKERVLPNANNNPWSANAWQVDGWKKVNELFDQNPTETPWSAWVTTKTDTSSQDNAGDVCTGKVNTTLTYQERSRTTTVETITTYERQQPSQNQSSGWLLVLNSENGGAVSVSSGAPGIDFLGQYDAKNFNPKSYKDQGKDSYFVAGSFSESGLPNSAILTSSENQFGLGTAMSRDGAALYTGEDGDLSDNNPLPDACFNSSDGNFVLVSSSKSGLGNTFNLLGKKCSKDVTIRRLSWREIY